MEITKSYIEFIDKLKSQIQTARIKAHLSVNREMILMYWNIGKMILEQQDKEGWGAKVISRVAVDLLKEFPEMKGLGRANLLNMRRFAQTYKDEEFVQQVAGQIPWYHNVTLLERVKNDEERLWYIRSTVENGWSRNVLLHQIDTNAYGRHGKSVSNFSETLPKVQSDLAQQIIKDPYNLEFLDLEKEFAERDLEKGLIENIKDFLLELGAGFSFMGSQYHLKVGDQDFYIDLLFYHVKLKCYVVIELKTGTLKPEYVGKMGFYLSVVDDLLKDENDNPSIGLILCKDKNKTIAEYALNPMKNPVSVSEFKMTTTLPKDYKDLLPSSKELKKKLEEVNNT